MQDKSDRYQYQPWYIKLWRKFYYLFNIKNDDICEINESYIITIPPLPSVELDKSKLQEAKQKRGESLRPPKIKISDDILNKIKNN